MRTKRLSLGLDLSTQGLSASVVDIDAHTKVAEHSIDYVRDPRLRNFGISREDYILPPRNEGEAGQPPQMYLAALDAMLADLKTLIPLAEVAVINTSGQQHGHVYLKKNAPAVFGRLAQEGAETNDLVKLLDGCLAINWAPIWMTSNTLAQAASVRAALGKERLIQLSGSDAQLRFTGIVVRHTAQHFPEAYQATGTIQLISSLVPAVLTANAGVPVDFGNGCGMSLMDYRLKRWSTPLMEAVSQGLPGGKRALRQKLPAIAAPDSIVGRVAPYFVRKYGMSPKCEIAAGSGDNPQSRVLAAGDLLSLGSSFVNMVSTDGKARDMTGAATAMYDGIGRPFMFGCRTNGALVWDRVRAMYGMPKDNYAPAETALRRAEPGQALVLWQLRDEAFPASSRFDLVRVGIAPSLETDYPGVVESSLAAVYFHSREFAARTSQSLQIVGGGANSREVLRRVAAIWNRPVFVADTAGAALGAAVAGVSALNRSKGRAFHVEAFRASLVGRSETTQPLPEDVSAFHRPGGYLERFAEVEARLISEHPQG